VLGPDGSEVRTRRVARPQAMERDIAHIRVEGAVHPFQVTWDHRICVRGPDGSTETMTAGSLAAREPGTVCILGGAEFQRVLEVRRTTEQTEVVEVTFEADAVVLAWVLPKCVSRRGRPVLQRAASVACMGSRLAVGDFDQSVSRTFLHWDDLPQVRRPRSEPARSPRESL